jgi:hypothetical protein
MGALRAFFRDHRRLVVVLTAMALAMKALVPAGYMIQASPRVLSVLICADASGVGHLRRMTILLNRDGGGSVDQHGKSDSTCPFTALSMATLGGADAPLLILALAFILVRAFAPSPPPTANRLRHDRPPLRGPPFMT